MSEVICISSSDDEENIKKTKKNLTKTLESKEPKAKKRKELITLSEDVKVKKSKLDANKSKYTNNDLSHSLNSSKSSHSSKTTTAINLLEKPGSSKRINGVENNLLNVNNVKKSVNSSVCMPSTSKQPSPVRKVIKPKLIVREKVPIPDPLENVFDNFIQVCKKKKNDAVTNKILEKLRRRYNKLNPIDRDSEELRLFLSGSLQKLLNNTNRFYSFIQEVQDEIKRRIKIPKTASPEKKESKVQNEQSNQKTEQVEVIQEDEIDGIQEDDKTLSEDTLRKVRKLEKAIQQCKKRIEELENQEVNFDDEEDSSYLQEDRYKRKLVELCNALAQIMGDKMLKREIYKKQLRRSDISEEMTGISSVDNAIINFINSGIKKVNRLKHIKNPSAIADFLRVPDYPDILLCISKCNDEKDLGLTKKKIEQLSRIAFKSIGRHLKKQRIKESEEFLSSLDATTEEDPAKKNKQLQEKLQKNKKEGDQKLNEIFKKFVDKQEGLSEKDLINELKTNSQSEEGTEDEKTEINEEDRKEHLIKQIPTRDQSDEETETNEVINLVQSEEKANDMNAKTDEEIKKVQCTNIEKNFEEEKKEIENVNNDRKVKKNLLAKNIQIKEIKVIVNKLQHNDIVKSENNNRELCEQKESSEFHEDEKASIDSNINSINSVSKNSDINVLSVDKDDEIQIFNNADEKDTNDKLAQSNLNTKSIDNYENLVSDIICTLKGNLAKNICVNNDNMIEDLTNDDSNDSSTSKKNCSDKNIKNKDLIEIVTQNSNSFSNFTTNTNQKKINSNEKNFKNTNSCNNNKLSETEAIIEKTQSKNNECSKNTLSIPQTEISEIITIDSFSPSNASDTEDFNKDRSKKSISNTKETYPVIESVEIIEISESSKNSSIDTVCIDTDKDSEEVNEKLSNKGNENKTASSEIHPFIKVCSFAKPPDSWKDSLSPEKIKQDTQSPKQTVLKTISKPVFVDLTLPSTSKQCINSSDIKRVIPLNKMVVKKVINNANSIEKTLPSIQRTGQPNVITIPKSNFDQRPNSVSPNNIRTPYTITIQRSEKSSN